MVSDGQIIVYGLIASNLIIYIMLISGIIKARKPLISRATNITDAFHVLEYWLTKAYPDLPNGFTWREVTRKLWGSDVHVDWEKIASALDKYEAYRYGGQEPVFTEAEEIFKLTNWLARGAKVAR